MLLDLLHKMCKPPGRKFEERCELGPVQWEFDILPPENIQWSSVCELEMWEIELFANTDAMLT
jgi:hypothetical protein